MDNDVKKLMRGAEKYADYALRTFATDQWPAMGQELQKLPELPDIDEEQLTEMQKLKLAEIKERIAAKRELTESEKAAMTEPIILVPYRWAFFEVHFAFPNLDSGQRETLAFLRSVTLVLNHGLRASATPEYQNAPGRAGVDILTSGFEQSFCEGKAIYHEHLKPALTDLQQRYVEQVLLNVEVPQ